MGIFDVPAAELIEAVAEDLKKQVKQPAWIDFVKSGRHRERAPHRRDWFYMRMASILYRIYKEGNLGTNRLRTYYGGKKSRGCAPHRFFRASGKIIRLSLQELEKAGLLKREKTGRVISSKGESYLNAKAKEVKKTMAEKLAKKAELASEKKKEQLKEQEKAAAEKVEKQAVKEAKHEKAVHPAKGEEEKK